MKTLAFAIILAYFLMLGNADYAQTPLYVTCPEGINNCGIAQATTPAGGGGFVDVPTATPTLVPAAISGLDTLFQTIDIYSIIIVFFGLMVIFMVWKREEEKEKRERGEIGDEDIPDEQTPIH